jgi:F0F1-type ATP synthase membrane subunit b/b'
MGLFTFVKSLFSKATQLETQLDSFVSDVAKVAPDTATNLRNDLNKVKTVKKKAEAKVAEVEAKVKKATTPKPPTTSSAKKKTTK